MKRVDVHAHCYPEFYIKEIVRMGMGEDGGLGPKLPPWVSTEDTLAAMDALGIDIQVLSLTAPGVCFDDAGASRDLASATNDFIAAVCKEAPTRFLGLASIPLNHPKHAFDELHRVLDDLGMDGIALGTHANGKYLSDEGFLPFLEELDRRRVPVALHPMNPIGADLFSREEIKLDILPAVGFLFETIRTMAQLTFKGVFERCRDLTFIVPHAGGGIPFIYPRWDTIYHSRPGSHPIKQLPSPPSHYLNRHYYDTTHFYYPSSLKCTVDFAGIDHILLGTDFPYSRMDGRAKDAIQGIEGYGFPEEGLEMILHKNAADLFPRILKLLDTP